MGPFDPEKHTSSPINHVAVEHLSAKTEQDWTIDVFVVYSAHSWGVNPGSFSPPRKGTQFFTAATDVHGRHPDGRCQERTRSMQRILESSPIRKRKDVLFGHLVAFGFCLPSLLHAGNDTYIFVAYVICPESARASCCAMQQGSRGSFRSTRSPKWPEDCSSHVGIWRNCVQGQLRISVKVCWPQMCHAGHEWCSSRIRPSILHGAGADQSFAKGSRSIVCKRAYSRSRKHHLHGEVPAEADIVHPEYIYVHCKISTHTLSCMHHLHHGGLT